MDLDVEHELHARRKSRNMGVLFVLLAFVVLVFGLTVVKVTQLGDMGLRERMDPPSVVVPDPDYQARQQTGKS